MCTIRQELFVNLLAQSSKCALLERHIMKINIGGDLNNTADGSLEISILNSRQDQWKSKIQRTQPLSGNSSQLIKKM